MNATFLRLEQTAGLSGHAFTLGVEQQQRARRRITLAQPEALARFASPLFSPNPVAGYRELLPEEVESVYYGYDYLGLGRVEDEDFGAFARRAGCTDTGTAACREGTRVAPLEVTRTGLYAADRFSLGPLRLDLGARYELFSHNRSTPEDPYALAPIVRVRDLGVQPQHVRPRRGLPYLQPRPVA